jgi:hypothetical protein
MNNDDLDRATYSLKGSKMKALKKLKKGNKVSPGEYNTLCTYLSYRIYVSLIKFAVNQL